MQHRLDQAAVTVLLDVRNPFAHLALRPAIALANELALDVDWLPLETPPLKPPSIPSQEDDRGVLHRRSRALALAAEIQIYADAQGIVIRDAYRSPRVAQANHAWLWVREYHRNQLPQYLLSLFEQYAANSLDPDEPKAISALLESLGLATESFTLWADSDGPAIAATLADELREIGFFQVPAYFVQGELFNGRQHLPMIRWILGGRTGPIPI